MSVLTAGGDDSGRRPRRIPLFANLLILVGAGLLVSPISHYVTGVRAQAGASVPSPAIREAGPIPIGDAVGRLEIPRVGLDFAVFEGVSESVLRKGPGHIPGTACPGLAAEPGNCVIAGHRDSFFRRLAGAREGDVVRFRSGPDERSYLLTTRRIVLPGEFGVMAPTAEARLTLITCYPFEWTGSAPYRLVWEASPLAETNASASTALGEVQRTRGRPASAR